MNSEPDVANYQEIAEKLKSNGIDVDNNTIPGVILPIQIRDDEEVFNQHTPEVMKYYNSKGMEIKVIRSNQKKTKYYVMQAADLILPTIYLLQDASFTIFLNILSNMIYSKLASSKSTVRVEVMRVKTKNKECLHYKIEGTKDEAIEIIEALKKRG